LNKLDWKLTTKTIGLWLVLLPIFSIIHEYGHAMACALQGNYFEVHLSMLLNYATCSGTLDNVHSFRMAGGFVSASLALVLFAGLKSVLVGKLKFIAIVLVVIGITQFFNMTMETYANDFYINSSSVLTGVNTLMAMVMLFFLIQRHSKPSQKVFVTHSPYIKNIEKEGKKPQSIFNRSIVDIIKGRKPKPVVRKTTPQEKTFASLDLLGDIEE